MLNFPVPYADELIYSLVARAGAHMGFTSPKQVLEEVFGNRHVIATVDLPNHLENLLRLFPERLGFSVERLAYEHTLFPLYAPFTTELRRKQCLEKMASNSQGTIHLVLGVAASRVKQSRYLRYCPCCLQRQLKEKGEYYWLHQWQIAGADCCLEHGQLIEAHIERHAYHRHQFFLASPSVCPMLPQKPGNPSAIKVARQVCHLLQLCTNGAASFAQWTAYYHQLADAGDCLAGHNIRHEAVKERVLGCWPTLWLESHGLAISDTESNWLHSIFRKHRKSFSYLEHIVVLDAFLPDTWRIDEVLAEVSSIRTSLKTPVTEPSIADESVNERQANTRAQWLSLIRRKSVKQARSENGALYATLYRHDRVWLLSTNRQFYLTMSRQNRRVDWRQRDMIICRQLIKIRNAHKSLLDSPRWSRNWYLSKLGKSAIIEKNIHKMPLTSLFFKRFCEDIPEYQIRRITKALSCLETENMHRWRLLRNAGLSDERLTNDARVLLHKMVGD
ncbi:MAG: TnsD family transposase [Methylobacter tundripaludum]|nr:TnsD family transposase [Methylobacter tundripaludum]